MRLHCTTLPRPLRILHSRPATHIYRHSISTFPSIQLSHFSKEQPTPCIFPRQNFLPKLPAFTKWFCHDDNNNTPSLTLNTSYLLSFSSDPLLPIEMIKPHPQFPSRETFSHVDLPFSVYLGYLSSLANQSRQSRQHLSVMSLPKMYLAQTPPPAFLVPDLTPSPFAELGLRERTKSVRGMSRQGMESKDQDKEIDVYSTSLWLGLSHTINTPLHKDPLDNIFIQLSGRKRIRTFPPYIGEIIVGAGTRGTMRGVDMMVGEEKERIDRIVWGSDETDDGIREEMLEVELERGDGVYIKKGWWHAVKGADKEEVNVISASVNWWYR